MLASCTGGEPEAEGGTVLRFLHGPDIGGAVTEVIARFEGLHPEIDVEMIEGPAATNTREDMYATSFMGGEGTYDLVYMDVIWVPKFAARGWLRPLDDLFTPAMQDGFLPGDIAGSRFEGMIYRVPVMADGGVLYFRKDLLERHGLEPPETWDELVSAAVTIQSPPELWGLVFQGKQYEGLVCSYLELLWGNGGMLLDEAGRVRIDEPAAIEALEWLADSIHRHRIAPEGVLTFQEEEARHIFQEGRALFMRNWPYAWRLLQGDDSPVKGRVGITAMVRGPRGERGAAALGGWGYGISALSRNPEAAWRFIKFATSAESQKIGVLMSGNTPARRSLFEDPDVIAGNPHYDELQEVLSGARPRPVHPAYARISDTLQIHLSAALSGQETPAAALQAAAEELRSFLR
ncbi:MAG: ABC transporter substrate-binding protein [Planctomycetota bacterium]